MLKTRINSDTTEMEMEFSGRIGNMDALLFTLSLEVVLMQIRILEGSTALRAQQWRCTEKIEKLQLDKLVNDREMVKDVIRRTLIDVAEIGDWCSLREAVDIFIERDTSALALRHSNEKYKRTRNDILNEIKTKRIIWASNLLNADKKIAILRDNINDDLLNANVRISYAEKWLFASFEEMELRCARQPARAPAPRADHEDRVHHELLTAYELQIKEREDLMEYWRQRFSDDTMKITESVAQKCDELRKATARRLELQKVYDTHEGEMRAWLTFKRERAARLAREARSRASATRIQSWWRGVMVRRALGAFKFLRNVKKTSAKSKKK